MRIEERRTPPTRHSEGLRKVIVSALALLLVAPSGCGNKFDYAKGAEMTGGDPQAGREKIIVHDCHSCHEIPGVPLNPQRKGPSLKHWAGQSTIAKKLPNTPENLEDYIEHPERMRHGSSVKNEMSLSSVKPADAKDIAAYLYSLR